MTKLLCDSEDGLKLEKFNKNLRNLIKMPLVSSLFGGIAVLFHARH
jgi:hypothetical protein